VSDVKRWLAMYHPLGDLAGPEVATMVLASDYDALKAENARLRKALQELVALVRGECPRLLDEDRDGDARLCIAIENALIDKIAP
jgi:hypothetical protein